MGAGVTTEEEAGRSGRITSLHLALLAVVFLAAFGLRPGTPTLRGEEPRWAKIASEMVEHDAWVVPRLQGSPALSRPPLQSWAIAASSAITRAFSPASIRLPGLLAILLTTLVTYFYAARFLGPLGAFAAGLAFLTSAQVLELGRLAETDALFAFFVSASLMLWHAGYCRVGATTPVWVLGYVIAALAMLTKGLQAPVYFIGAVTAYLFLRRDVRSLLSRPHAVGLVVFIAVVGAWQIPFLMETDWLSTRRIWLGDVAIHTRSGSPADVLRHAVLFPGQAALATLPWSACLLCYASRDSFRLFRHNEAVRFAATALGLAFVTCWLPAGGKTRYLMTAYPMLAVLVGAVVERARLLPPSSAPRRILNRLADGMTLVMVVCAALVAVVTLTDWEAVHGWRQPWWFAFGYTFLALMCAGVGQWSRRRRGAAAAHIGLLAVAVFMVATVAGVHVNKLVNTAVDTAGAVAQARARMAPEHRLFSLGPVLPLFAYHYGEPIGRLDRLDAPELSERGAYFCFVRPESAEAAFPFLWREVSAVPVHVSVGTPDKRWVVIGQIIPPG